MKMAGFLQICKKICAILQNRIKNQCCTAVGTVPATAGEGTILTASEPSLRKNHDLVYAALFFLKNWNTITSATTPIPITSVRVPGTSSRRPAAISTIRNTIIRLPSR